MLKKVDVDIDAIGRFWSSVVNVQMPAINNAENDQNNIAILVLWLNYMDIWNNQCLWLQNHLTKAKLVQSGSKVNLTALIYRTVLYQNGVPCAKTMILKVVCSKLVLRHFQIVLK